MTAVPFALLGGEICPERQDGSPVTGPSSRRPPRLWLHLDPGPEDVAITPLCDLGFAFSSTFG